MKIGFITKLGDDKSKQLLVELTAWLTKHGHIAHSLAGPQIDQLPPAKPEDIPSMNFAVTLGGDGTMLQASRLLASTEVPVLGINLGRLGFLASFDPQSAISALKQALAGQLTVAKRMRLQLHVYNKQSEEIASLIALNDVVLHQGKAARLIDVTVLLDNSFVATYRADGIIIATPTGSTAYNLAAGGPILLPGHTAMTLTPICAHALTNRPLVVPATSTLQLEVSADQDGTFVTTDGQCSHPLASGEYVTVTHAQTPFLVFDSGKAFFDVMRDKLHWGYQGQGYRN